MIFLYHIQFFPWSFENPININHDQASLTIIHHDIPMIFPCYSHDIPIRFSNKSLYPPSKLGDSGLARRGSGRSGHAGFLSGADLSVQFDGELNPGELGW